jgi:hypothetical protein
MAEAKKPAPTKLESVLIPASEAADPAVHALLARRQTAVLNGDEETAAAVAADLAELGYK